MIRAWLAIALLAGSWLLGLGYYRQPDWPAWFIVLALAIALFLGVPVRWPDRKQSITAAVLLLPVLWLTPWPYQIIPLLIVVGLLILAAPWPVNWPRNIGSAAACAGLILLAQSIAFFLYESLTARTHELPGLLASLISAVASIIGLDSGLSGTTLAVGTMRKVHPLGATWELLLDPATLCFFVGGFTLLALRRSVASSLRGSASIWLHQTGRLAVAILLWLPLRVGLLLALFTHRALITDYDAPLDLMNQFYSPWVHLLMLMGAVGLAWRFIPELPSRSSPAPPSPSPKPQTFYLRHRREIAFASIFIGIALITFGWFWDPVGSRKPGYVLVDEFHSKWEPTDKPMDTTWYGHSSGYNYASLYDYASRFYDMHRLTSRIDEKTLAGCDVLIVKVPTARYAPDEIAMIRRFVERGGGLMLVGEHTNVFGTGTHLNDIARTFGFTFRYDCLFGIDSTFEQLYRIPNVPHPITQRMPPMDFAVSCSIDPGFSLGRAAIRGTGLKNVPADYHASNFYPQVEDRAESRYGAFVQLWTTRHGDGRIAAFTDSTIWSNFCTFEPGKSELFLGMIEWLNHRNTLPDPFLWLLIPGGALALFGLYTFIRLASLPWLAIISLALLSWSISTAAARTLHSAAMPEPRNTKPLVRVAIDRTASSAILPKDGFIAGKPEGFGIFERWIQRVGYFTQRRSGLDAFRNDAQLLVIFQPDKPVDDAYRAGLLRYISEGGHLLLLDSTENRKSTANSILRPFGLTIDRSTAIEGNLIAPGFPSIPVTAAAQVKGGQPFATVTNMPVAARARYGKGTVTAIGFGSRFNDANMGVTGDIIPDQKMRDVYEVQFRLLRWIVEGPSATQPSTTQPYRIEGSPD